MEGKTPQHLDGTAPSFEAFMKASSEYEHQLTSLVTTYASNRLSSVNTAAATANPDFGLMSPLTTTSRTQFLHTEMQCHMNNTNRHQSPSNDHTMAPEFLISPPFSNESSVETIHQVQARYRHLTTQLRTQTQRREAAEKEVRAVRSKMEEMSRLVVIAQAKVEEAGKLAQKHAAEMADLRGDLEAGQGYTADLRGRYKVLKSGHDAMFETAGTLQTRADVAESRIVGLEKQVRELEQDREAKEPLCKVGVDVRLRFLEQAKELIQYIKRNRLNHRLIEKGNRAAHDGIGEADAALLTIDGLLSKGAKPIFTDVFKELYHEPPSTYLLLPAKLREAIAYEATIRTLNILNTGLHRPLLERQQAIEHISIIQSKFPKFSGEEFNEDADINRRLELVKELTGKIVEYDRKRDGRADGGKSPDSKY